MAEKINVAVVGYGFAGKVFHAPLIATTDGLTLHTVVSSDASKVRADYPGVAVVADLATALADPAVDLVVIATPNIHHAPMAHAALAAGKHVVVDKPFTTTVDEATALVAHAKAVNKIISVYQNRRWDSDFLTLHHLVVEGALGEVMQAESRFDRYRPTPKDNWREEAGPGSGIWFDLGSHLLDQALVLFGRPQALYADFAEQRPHSDATDFFHVVLRYPTLRFTLQAGCVLLDHSFRLSVHGTKGSYIKYGLDAQENDLKAGLQPGTPQWGYDPRPGRLTTTHNDVVTTREITGITGNYPAYYAGMRDHIRGLAANPVPNEQSLELMRLLLLAERSFLERRELRAL